MPLPEDMRRYQAPDAFQLISPSAAFYALLFGAVVGIIFAPVMR